MNISSLAHCRVLLLLGIAVPLFISGCKSGEQGDGAPPPAKVLEVPDMNLLTVEPSDAEKFPITTVGQYQAQAELNATGTVFPDISREVPVISLANGRVVDVKARLDDNVKKGQLLFTVQSTDVTGAYNTYVKAVSDEQVANKAYLRAQDLYGHNAISQAVLEQAEGTEKDAHADVVAAEEQLKLFGVDKAHPTNLLNVYAPESGVIVAQNITSAGAAGVSLAGSATAFTIADLSSVWVLCDVYENDLSKVRLGQEARIVTNAYSDKPITGRISDIGPVLDPTLRTAKVRIQVSNPGFLKLGMFATATFTSTEKQTFASVPSDAVLHLHDRDWIYVPVDNTHFRRIEVRAGRILDNGRQQQILSGVTPGQRIVTHALLLDAAGTQP